jgi:RNA polymerase sigma-70 factor (ECF subfamily)
MAQTRRLVDTRILQPAQTAVALKLITEMDFLRLKAVARLYARGLPPDIGWDDLLQEAFTRVIVGSRRVPEGVTMVAFIAGVIRSLRSEHWRRARRESGRVPAVRLDDSAEPPRDVDLADPGPDPQRALSARQELKAIERLFADDRTALQIIAGLGNGLSAEQIRAALKISKTEYDSARKRMRRKLLREGLTCVEP